VSVIQLINNFASGVSDNPYDGSVEVAQRRRWLKNALSKINRKWAIPNAHSLVSVVKDESDVILPVDYKYAKEPALMAVEYGYSRSFAASAGIDLSLYEGSIAQPIAARLASKPVGVTPKPKVGKVQVYGVTREALKLHRTPSANRSEILVYYASYAVEDERQRLIIKSNPDEGLIIEIADIAYTLVIALENPNDSAQILIGSSKTATARNISSAVNNKTEETGVRSVAVGEAIDFFGESEELDFEIFFERDIFTLEQIQALNTLDSKTEDLVWKFMEASQYSFLSDCSSIALTDKQRDLYARKAERLFTEVDASLSIFTI
jgi:hypothetical protein